MPDLDCAVQPGAAGEGSRVLTAVLGEYVRAYDAGILPGLLARLPHGGPGGDHPVLGLLGAHSVAADYRTMPLRPRSAPTRLWCARGAQSR